MTPETEQGVRRGLLFFTYAVFAITGVYIIVAMLLLLDGLLFGSTVFARLPDSTQEILGALYGEFFRLLMDLGLLPPDPRS